MLDRSIAVETSLILEWILTTHFQIPPCRMVGHAGKVSHCEDAGMRDEASEAIGLRTDPVRHVPAKRTAHCHDSPGIDIDPRFDGVCNGHEVFVALVAPHITPDPLNELLTKA